MKLLKVALDLAKTNTNMERARMCSLIIHRNNIKAVGFNQLKSHPLQAKYSPNPESIYLHAEIDAIKNYTYQYGNTGLDKCTLVVARVYKNGKPALARPCCGCWKAIEAFNLSDVIWSK